MDIPLNVGVYCADGHIGTSTYVILCPVTEQVTHLVVKSTRFPHTAYLIPLENLVESTPHQIQLSCTKHELARMDPFVETEFIPVNGSGDTDNTYLSWPYVIPDGITIPVEHERIPPHELAIRRGAKAMAADGQAGRIDEFLVDPASGHITHLVLREGHFWGQKDITIPVSAIERIEEDIIYLKLSRHEIETLPTIPLRRRYEKGEEAFR